MVSNLDENYFLLFKTADAEKRAWRNLSSKRRSAITPIVELSRGKKRRNAGKDKAGKECFLSKKARFESSTNKDPTSTEVKPFQVSNAAMREGVKPSGGKNTSLQSGEKEKI